METPLVNRSPLVGQVALVTGSVEALGREIALGLAKHGADMVIHYRSSESDAREVADGNREISARRAITLKADLQRHLSNPQRCSRKPRPNSAASDILVNSAASFVQTEFAKTPKRVERIPRHEPESSVLLFPGRGATPEENQRMHRQFRRRLRGIPAGPAISRIRSRKPA